MSKELSETGTGTKIREDSVKKSTPAIPGKPVPVTNIIGNTRTQPGVAGTPIANQGQIKDQTAPPLQTSKVTINAPKDPTNPCSNALQSGEVLIGQQIESSGKASKTKCLVLNTETGEAMARESTATATATTTKPNTANTKPQIQNNIKK